MSKFYVEPEALAGSGRAVYTAGEDFLAQAHKVREVKDKLALIMSSYPAISMSIDMSAGYAEQVGRKTMDYGTAIFEIAKLYQAAEDVLTGNAAPSWTSNFPPRRPVNPIDILWFILNNYNWRSGLFNPIGFPGIVPGITPGAVGLIGFFNNMEFSDDDTGESFKFRTGGGYGGSRTPFTDKWSKDGFRGQKNHMSPDELEKERQFKGDEDSDNNPLFKIAGVEYSNSLLHDGKKFGDEDGPVQAEIHGDVLKLDAHADAFASGMGVGVGAGASLTALSFGGSTQFGNDTLGAHAEANVDVLKGSLEGQAQFGFDKNGNFACGAEGHAEAILAEVSGRAGYDILGTDIDATGSLNVGIGAHGSIGYIDGKLKIEGGASLGVGFSLGVEVDVSDTIANFNEYKDTVVDAAEAAWDFTTDAAGDLADAAGDMADAAGDFADGVADFFGW